MATRHTYRAAAGAAIVLAIVASAAICQADEYTVFGTISTAGEEAVAGAEVSVSGIGLVTITDERGDYEVNGVPAGSTCTVRPAHPAYTFEPASRTITIASGDEWVDFTATAVASAEGRLASIGGVSTLATSKATQRVTYPDAAGITWSLTSNYTITWQGFVNAQVRIQLWKGGSLERVITSGTPNDGSFVWQVPGDVAAGSDYRIRVSEDGWPWTPDFSNNYFSIAGGNRKVTYPSASGIAWTTGVGYTITWENFTCPEVRIQLWKGGSLERTISTGTTNDGSFPWTVAGDVAAGNDYRIRVSERTSPWTPDFSNNYFSITGGNPKVTYPSASGITWTTEVEYTVTWENFASPEVRIQLWKDGSLERTISTGATNDGSFPWTVPGDVAAGSDYMIRVSEKASPWTPDFSNNYFSIAGGGDGGVTRRAVCVGVSDYVGTSSDLSFCDDDAVDFGNALAAFSDWDAANIEVIVDRQATAANIWAALNAMSAASDANDQCVFFFSGHGGWGSDRAPIDEADGKDEYLCESDFANNIYDDELGDWVADLPTNNVFIVLCACFSGGAIKSEDSVKSVSPADGGSSGFVEEINAAIADKTRGLQDVDDAGAGMVLAACDDHETCQESYVLQHDVFNHYVLQAMAGAGDANFDNIITGEEIYAYATPLATAYNGGQHAQIYDANPGSAFVLGTLSP